jgi:hypothetical protein
LAQTVANLADVMKEVWTSDRLEKQFYDENPFLDRIEKTDRFTIGKQAQVPIHKGRSGGYTVTPAAGSTALNAADEQKVDQAAYTIPYHWFQIRLEAAALNQAGGGAQSVASALDLEVTGAIADERKQIMRQIVGNGDSLIAQCTTTSGSTTLNLLNTGYGFDAIERGWLYPGLLIDVGTTSNETFRSADNEITAVSEDSTTPTLTVSSSLTTASTDYVSVANARSGATSYEMNGLRQIFGSTTSGVGGLDPDNAGEEFWKPAKVDTSTTTLTLDLLLDMQRATFQKGGQQGYYILTSLKQQANLYSLLQNQVRFSSDSQIGAGNVNAVKWNGMEINALPDVPNRELYLVRLDDLFIVTGSWKKPQWVSDIEGGGGRLRWVQGQTGFADAVVYPINLAVRRRSAGAAAIGLTA